MSGHNGGFEYRDYVKRLENLKRARLKVKREINYAVIALAAKFVEILEYNSPYDTGLLSESWTWDIEYVGDKIHISIWNLARNKNGQLYMEWVNDGHRLVVDGVQVGYVEGQFFLELSEHEVLQQLPNWKINTERLVAKVIAQALKG